MRLDSECIDRISNLPDAILGQILSYLPIEKVIATSILSTRWKSLFPTHVPLTELVLEDYKSDTPSQNFIDFVDNLLFATLSDVPRVEKVVIASETKYHDYLIDSWVRGALELNVEHLRLVSNLEDSAYVFDSLYGCEALVELEIGGDFRLLIPEGFFLPNLKRLTLYSVLPLEDPNSVQELMDGCPVLDELNFSGCNLCCLENLYIRHPLITKLCIERSFYEAGCKIVIDAPKLEAFAYEGHFVANYDMKNVESLHSVCIQFDIFSQDAYEEGYRSKARRLAKLVKGCSRTARLCLSGNSLTALYRSRVPLPTFQNVTCLALGRMGSHGLKFLAHLFKSVPSLTTLIFEEKVEVTRTFADFISTLPSLRVIAELHVKKIEIWDFEGWQNELEFIACLLKNGRVLQELIVHCLPCKNTSALEKLSMLPRCSKACQVLLRGNAKRGESRYARSNWF